MVGLESDVFSLMFTFLNKECPSRKHLRSQLQFKGCTWGQASRDHGLGEAGVGLPGGSGLNPLDVCSSGLSRSFPHSAQRPSPRCPLPLAFPLLPDSRVAQGTDSPFPTALSRRRNHF